MSNRFYKYLAFLTLLVFPLVLTGEETHNLLFHQSFDNAYGFSDYSSQVNNKTDLGLVSACIHSGAQGLRNIFTYSAQAGNPTPDYFANKFSIKYSKNHYSKDFRIALPRAPPIVFHHKTV